MRKAVVEFMLYYNDRPLSNPANDVLGYSKFAENMAFAINKLDTSEGFVIGLYGKWGMGKSTLLKFVEYYLADSINTGNLIIFHFNPWWIPDKENLIKIFFEQLSLSLKSESERKNEEIKDKIQKAAKVVAKVPGVEIAEALASFLSEDAVDIVKRKQKIDKSLKEFGIPILVTIDDIDRLSTDEIQQIFKLVKSVADFSNVIYLLAFDDTIVSQALSDVQNLPGKEYLEKIIQLPLTLPMPSSNAIARMFETYINMFFPSDTPLYDEQRLIDFYQEGISNFLKTPRDIVRISNSIRFTFPLVRGEVNVADFIVIELIRVFAHKLYNIIRTNRRHFTGFSFLNLLPQSKEEFNQFHETWIKEFSEYKNLLTRLFPVLQNIDRPGTFNSNFISIEWRRNGFIANDDNFDTYFRLQLDSKLSRSRMDMIIASSADKDLFKSHLKELIEEINPDDSFSIDLFLARIRDYSIDSIITLKEKNVITALLELGDSLYDKNEEYEQRGLFNTRRIERVAYCIISLIKTVSPENRFKTIEEGFESCLSLASLATIISYFGNDFAKYGSEVRTSSPIITLEELSKLEVIFADKALNSSKNKAFLDIPYFRRVLAVWNENDSENTLKWVKTIIENTTNAMTFFTKFLEIRSTFFGNSHEKHTPIFNFKSLEKYIEYETIIELATNIAQKVKIGEMLLTEHEQQTIDLILLGRSDDEY